MAIPDKIIELVDVFDRNIEDYKSGQYKETQVRHEFIDPFFQSLGWDVNNADGHAEAYKDVVHEDTIKVGNSPKSPDYCFRIGGVRKFFLEAKKPSVHIKEDTHPAYQLRRYAWSAKLPLSILTDFEEFAIYDCRIKPAPNDKASTARVRYFTYKEYHENWAEIASIFSKDAILKGSHDKYIESSKVKRGTAEVDKAFLGEIEQWRENLARNIALRNPRLTHRELNFSVQRTIDRLIFLRICEDRGIEDYGILMSLQNGENVYNRLCEQFYRADELYNSGLFHFKKEKGYQEPHDELTLSLSIDDKPLKDILKNLYYPDSPYEFSVLPSDILGQVYEQFLGKVIHLTSGHRAVVEDKPEVKKAGGVYYTPTYIVDYIVKNTVGKLLEGKTPAQVTKLRVLDPACGSGSFLIGAYQFLLDWHREWYKENDPEKWTKSRKPTLCRDSGGDWRLTTDERKRILLNNIYGVDIDHQAVEVTKLSLLLKVLEGENQQTISTQYKLFHDRVLPNLSNNIKCGNSLIGSDFYDGAQIDLFDDEERYRINVFDWEIEFEEIFKAGGFDAVIGNPPYVRIQGLKEWAPKEVEFYKNRYKSASKGNYDLYVVFVEKGLSLLNDKGSLGYILPHKFFKKQYGEKLRSILSKGNYLHEIVHFGSQQVFANATTYTCLMFLEKNGDDQCQFIKVDNINEWLINHEAVHSLISNIDLSEKEWNFVAGKYLKLFNKLSQMPLKLGDIADIFVGLQTSADDVFILDLVKENEKTIILKSKALNAEWTFEKKLLFPIVSGTDVNRYSDLPKRQYIIFPYRIVGSSVELIDLDEILQEFPKTASYLLENKKKLESREKGKTKGEKWHGYIYLKNMIKQSIRKLCVPRLVENLYAAYDREGDFCLDNVDVGGVSLKHSYKNQILIYILGLLNSKLLKWYFPFVSEPFRGGWLSANRQFLSQIPIRTINFSDPSDKSNHDRMVELVESMLSLHKKLAKTKTAHDKTVIQRQIDATDKRIDKLVYELYGLTEEEIKIVEGEAQ